MFSSYCTVNSFRLGYNKTASHVLRDLVHRLPRRSLFWKCYVYDFLGYAHKCNFSYAHMKSRAFPVPICAELKCWTALYCGYLTPREV